MIPAYQGQKIALWLFPSGTFSDLKEEPQKRAFVFLKNILVPVGVRGIA